MPANTFTKGLSPSPFPNERQCRAMNEEDQFMQTHGGSGSRGIYAIVMSVEASFNAILRMPAATVRQVGRIRAKGIRKPNSPSAAGAAHAIHQK